MRNYFYIQKNKAWKWTKYIYHRRLAWIKYHVYLTKNILKANRSTYIFSNKNKGSDNAYILFAKINLYLLWYFDISNTSNFIQYGQNPD